MKKKPPLKPDGSNTCRDPHEELLNAVKANLPKLTELLEKCDSSWGGEDYVYRFWHYSFKVYYLQDYTTAIVRELESLCPVDGKMNPWFVEIVEQGTGKTFDISHNKGWLKHTRPLVEAYFHAHYMLTMVVKYGNELDKAPGVLPSGWAAVLELYQIR